MGGPVAYHATILLVCSANICRSPMAEHILHRQVERAGDATRLLVASAGTWAMSDEPASDTAQQIMAEDGYDLSAHRSHSLNQQDIDNAELILVMTRGQREDILARFSRVEGKIRLLSEMAGKGYDIADPYGGTTEDYAHTKGELENILALGYQRILALALGLEKSPGKRRFKLF
jgi:protein-tyrosine phosphatase